MYVGHVLTSEGLKPGHDKEKAVSMVPRSTEARDTQSTGICELVPQTLV